MSKANFKQKIDTLIDHKFTFLGVFFVVFLLSYLFLVAIDFVPEPKVASVDTSDIEIADELDITDAPVVDEAVLAEPTMIYIEKLDREVVVLNPTSRAIADLDEALLEGVVRHPDSALLGQEGNVFLLGHSSYLPNVFNENFQAFNGIQNLEWGDEIVVRGASEEFIYRVDRVYKATADDATIVPITGVGKRLTLATCDSFGSITDRFIVEATQVRVNTL